MTHPPHDGGEAVDIRDLVASMGGRVIEINDFRRQHPMSTAPHKTIIDQQRHIEQSQRIRLLARRTELVEQQSAITDQIEAVSAQIHRVDGALATLDALERGIRDEEQRREKAAEETEK